MRRDSIARTKSVPRPPNRAAPRIHARAAVSANMPAVLPRLTAPHIGPVPVPSASQVLVPKSHFAPMP
ncbi:hypothetical protein B0T26DRAFT_104083 [Lasiosphaeria miniovina]|uniref:Uncharacterized protein n=1 Tax=Lasiosphaeria miniovina TaxID=1954250 RepID=A0AA40B355_9PEZI|nr:uncharacterized protein B0T26DRAFT_104083 [Lasiosphaeria miniovina]KAK0726794.1 hypothetical protein B0T26DRAFT_104083 [Lasiosphaeria miniovina]